MQLGADFAQNRNPARARPLCWRNIHHPQPHTPSKYEHESLGSISHALLAFFSVRHVAALSYTVTNTADNGAGSLRQAIIDANGYPGSDVIVFDIPGPGVHTITPFTALPVVTGIVTIDGYTQSGSSPNTLAGGDNAVLLIEISGANVGNAGNGLVLGPSATGSKVSGLVINNGWSAAILVQTANAAVDGCFLGTDVTGTIAKGNGHGVKAALGTNTSGMRVGGAGPGARNLISGNGTGVLIGVARITRCWAT